MRGCEATRVLYYFAFVRSLLVHSNSRSLEDNLDDFLGVVVVVAVSENGHASGIADVFFLDQSDELGFRGDGFIVEFNDQVAGGDSTETAAGWE